MPTQCINEKLCSPGSIVVALEKHRVFHIAYMTTVQLIRTL